MVEELYLFARYSKGEETWILECDGDVYYFCCLAWILSGILSHVYFGWVGADVWEVYVFFSALG